VIIVISVLLLTVLYSVLNCELLNKLEPTRWVVVSGYDPVAGLVELGAVAE